ncbi:arf-GAP with Rho-GAP domain, ANK repeat and PH domain-containing protein 1 isoform X3 [Syngnathus acus]|uniref:arf-GAP with Rho-GAP domain, ANK repeat and PH domain-containing protein 1 isoform X3 n=1 Tax=Syngnathus acus TaxID=161584 RepID=UPI001885F716|nr:arf-GAP with Rho-GAP domain, ANK repeat and PH domain-containing protein 1 isoform X3 [Syngnathus acus]
MRESQTHMRQQDSRQKKKRSRRQVRTGTRWLRPRPSPSRGLATPGTAEAPPPRRTADQRTRAPICACRQEFVGVAPLRAIISGRGSSDFTRSLILSRWVAKLTPVPACLSEITLFPMEFTSAQVPTYTMGTKRARHKTAQRAPVSKTGFKTNEDPGSPALAFVGDSGSGPSLSSPPSIRTMASNIAKRIPSLAGAASTIGAEPSPAPTPNPGATLSSLSNIPSLAEMLSAVANSPSQRSAKGVPLPKPDDAGVALDSPAPTRGQVGVTEPEEEDDDLYITVLESWDHDDIDTDSSDQEELYQNCPPATNGAMRGDFVHEPLNSTNRRSSTTSPRPAPPPKLHLAQSAKGGKSSRQKTPGVATIRVSRKKGHGPPSGQQSAVVRASWLDVWKGFRHNVFWATLDGQLMSLWKKRTDQFSEVLFHVSGITNVKKLDRGRFSIYFKKKHYDFLAYSDDVQDGWVRSLLASRGQPGPAGPDLHGAVTVKDPKSRFYAAVWGHDLWVYQNKEGFQLGVACYSIPLNLATVQTTGRHSFTLATPFRTFGLSVDSSKDLSVWLEALSSSISSALSCSQVVTRLWKNPSNRQCADCGAADPEWAAVNLLLVICHSCAGQHRALGSTLSKVRSLKMDNKVWTEPLIQLFVGHGNRLANQVWAPVVPSAEQIAPEASHESRSKFIRDKYSKGRYRRLHTLASSPQLMQQRLRQVVCGGDVEETFSLLCSGSKVCQTDPQSPSAIQLAERAGQALQAELLRLNEYTEVPRHLPKWGDGRAESRPSGKATLYDAFTEAAYASPRIAEEDEKLHGKLEDDRFLFSLENDSAACDVLDLREVSSLFRNDEATFQFELITLDNQLLCVAESEDENLIHLVHILKVILPAGVSDAEMRRALGVSKVHVVEDGGSGGASENSEAWLLLWDGGVSVHRARRGSKKTMLKMELSALSRHEMDPAGDIITMVLAHRRVSLHFDAHDSCGRWYRMLQDALADQKAPESPVTSEPPSDPDSVPLAIRRCVRHIQKHGGDFLSYLPSPFLKASSCPTHSQPPSIVRRWRISGLKVEGVYRRCGLASKVSQLAEALARRPDSAPLESGEQGVLDAAAALKQYIRQQVQLFPEDERNKWMRAAGISDERARFSAYRRLLRQMPAEKRGTLDALFGHFYTVQTFSQVNKMSAHNLALVLVPSLFDSLNGDLLKLTRELVLHHAPLFHFQLHHDEEEITVL